MKKFGGEFLFLFEQSMVPHCSSFDCFISTCNWRASEASETLSGITNGNWRYILIYIYFSSTGPVLRNVEGVKCQPFLKRSNN